jgi:hypothetical protein
LDTVPLFISAFVEDIVLTSLQILGAFLEVSWPHMFEFISGLPIQSHWSMCLFLFQ